MKNANEFNRDAWEVLKERGFIHSTSHEDELKKALEGGPITFYLGIDPTADNLHIGHFFALQVFRILQNHGHNGIILLGNATAMIGDPSFKNEMRKLMSQKELNKNAKKIRSLLGRFIDMNSATLVYNASWMKKENFIAFMRRIGTHFNVNEMLTKDCYKNRLKDGLTIFEMSYMLLQANDFIHLNDKFGCTLQIGGTDQWSNILGGVELGRKVAHRKGRERPLMMAMCNPLLTKTDGTKMGKTEKGTLWVTGEPYDCFQHFVNIPDEDVERLLMFFSPMAVKDIKSLCKADIVLAKKMMAFEVTKKIHGEMPATIARDTASALFTKPGDGEETTDQTPADAPSETVTIAENSNIVDVLALVSVIGSKREARELIDAGAILIDNEKITDHEFVPPSEFLLKKGKKTFVKITVNNS